MALVGNPNTGKSTVFNSLTGHRQRVGNYPGVTVERRAGFMRGEGEVPSVQVVDLPGAYSLAAHGADEALVMDVLLGRLTGVAEPDLIVVVVDATNLGRNLFFTTQVLEIGKPVVVGLNMIDVAEAAGLQIDSQALGRELSAPVVPIVATKRIGIESLKRAILESLEVHPRRTPDRRLTFPDCVTAELDGLTKRLPVSCTGPDRRTCRAEALQMLLDPGGYHEERMVKRFGKELAVELAERRGRIQAAGETISEVEARVRYAWINGVIERATKRIRPARRSRSDAVDRVLTHRVLGLVILLAIMGLCFQAIYTWAAPMIDAIDRGLAALGDVLVGVIPPGALQSLVVDGVIAGVGAVLAFLPQILILFLFIVILEDCGYLARTAFLLDRSMGFVGLCGKSFIPLLSSFACAVPGIMAARIIENRRDRILTILIAPLMSCSARLPVYTLLIGAFVPAKPLLGGVVNLQALTLLGLCLVGTIVAIPVALIFRHTILRGEVQSFLMELPAYKRPSVRTVFYRIYEQGKAFCVSAGTIIFAMTIVVWALGYYPRPASVTAAHDALRAAARQAHQERMAAADGGESADRDSLAILPAPEAELQQRLLEIDRSESHAYMQRSLLGRMGRWIEPIVRPMGWDWRIGTAVIASLPAREIVVATMGTIYNLEGEGDEASVGLRARLREVTWPDGRRVFNLAVALSIMVFFALCCQCGGTLATIKRETNSWRWPLFTFAYMTVLAYLGAWATYQVVARLI